VAAVVDDIRERLSRPAGRRSHSSDARFTEGLGLERRTRCR
jgi:hypothetical protein